MLEFIIQNTVFALFLILVISLAIGSLSWKGISLGLPAVLLVSMVFGHYGATIPKEITNLGLVLFVYAIGLQAGPGFFKSIKEHGRFLVLTCALGTGISGLATLGAAKIFHIPPDIATGIFAGSNTNTPLLASAIEFATKMNFDPGNISVGYGLAYPFSIILVVLALQLIPSFFKKQAAVAEERWLKGQKDIEPLVVKHFRVINPACFGKKAVELHDHNFGDVNISRIFRHGEIIPVTVHTQFHKDDIVTVVGLAESVGNLGLVFGEEEKGDRPLEGYNVVDRKINVFSSQFIGKTLHELEAWKKHNVVITRILKNGYEIFPTDSYELEYSDIITVIGPKKDIETFAQIVSDVDSKTNETSFLPFFLGLTAGIFIGLLPIDMFGLHIKLGMSTGAFFVSLIIGYYGKIGSLKIYVPKAASSLTRDLGLMLFLAGAGTAAGSNLVEVIQQQGSNILWGTFVISILTIIVPLLALLFYKKLDLYSSLGTFSGYMSDLSALIAAKNKININIAMLSFSIIYPFSLIFKILFVQLLMILLQFI
jgi:putative transport protein